MTRNESNAAKDLLLVDSTRDDAEDAAGISLIEEDRERLVRMIGHELRSPLSAISLGIDLVQRDSPPKAWILARMKHSVERMDRLIDELLRAARADEDEPVARREARFLRLRLLERLEDRPPREGEKGGRP
jgi:signal transduction histidine kinase